MMARVRPSISSLFVALALASSAWAETAEQRVAKIASDAQAHDMLVRLCDDFGGRLSGSSANEGALRRLEEELRQLGLQPERTSFTMPGWVRGDDRVEMLTPVPRRLRAAALAYSAAHDAFDAPVVDLGSAAPADYEGKEVRGRVGLVDWRTPVATRELARTAEQRGLRALLYLNRVDGGQLLARTSSFDGAPLPLPFYSITQEEGRWLQRLLARGITPVVRIETLSRPQPVTSANLAVRLPGRTSETVVVGAHFDSWDLGQGAMDNGLGIAQLFALAKALRGHSFHRSIDLVWFNGEEQGLWGSRHQAPLSREYPVVVMLNLDMVGVPTGVNALGDDDLVPVLQRWNSARGSLALERGVENSAWFGSDHVPYQLAGVRAVTFYAPIDPAAVRYYHDAADTVDKVPLELVQQSSTIIASLVAALAEDVELPTAPRDPEQTQALFKRFGLDRRMETAGYHHTFP